MVSTPLSTAETVLAWTTDLATGAPLEGVSVALTGVTPAASGADGTARLSAAGSGPLLATLGADFAMLPRSFYRYDEGAWALYPAQDELRWYVIDDRQLYQPGETVHVKGWLRLMRQQRGDIGLVGPQLRQVEFQVIDPQGNVLTSGEAAVSALGGFDFSFELPENANLGYASINLSTFDVAGLQWPRLLSRLPDPGVPPA